MNDFGDAFFKRFDEYFGTERAKKLLIAILVVSLCAAVGAAYSSLRPLIQDAARVATGNETALANLFRVGLWALIAFQVCLLLYLGYSIRDVRRRSQRMKMRDDELDALERQAIAATASYNHQIALGSEAINGVAEIFSDLGEWVETLEGNGLFEQAQALRNSMELAKQLKKRKLVAIEYTALPKPPKI